MNSEDTVHALLYHGIKARTDPDNAEIQNHIRGWKIEIYTNAPQSILDNYSEKIHYSRSLLRLRF